MVKRFIQFILFLLLLLLISLVYLGVYGFRTNKFNNLISNKASQTKNINLELKTIKFKINPKELSLFLETQKPKIIFREVLIPVRNIKVYVDFF